MSRNVKDSQEIVSVTGQQQQAIALLLAGKTQAETAAEVGAAPETLSRWLHNDPAFVAAYNAARLELWTANSARLRDLAGKAIDTIAAILQDETESSAVRLRAALIVLKDLGMNDKPGGAITPGGVSSQWQLEAMMEALQGDLGR